MQSKKVERKNQAAQGVWDKAAPIKWPSSEAQRPMNGRYPRKSGDSGGKKKQSVLN